MNVLISRYTSYTNYTTCIKALHKRYTSLSKRYKCLIDKAVTAYTSYTSYLYKYNFFTYVRNYRDVK